MSRRRLIRVRDLRAAESQANKVHHRILYCWVCGGEYSATPGDYFWATEDHVFGCCGQPNDLVVKSVVFTPVKLARRSA